MSKRSMKRSYSNYKFRHLYHRYIYFKQFRKTSPTTKVDNCIPKLPCKMRLLVLSSKLIQYFFFSFKFFILKAYFRCLQYSWRLFVFYNIGIGSSLRTYALIIFRNYYDIILRSIISYY